MPKPRVISAYPHAVREIRKSFDEARYRECADLYDEVFASGAAPAEAALLRARVFLRTDVPQAVSLLNRLRVPSGGPEKGAVEMLLGEAHALLDNYESADVHFDRAYTLAESIGDLTLRSQIAYRVGRRFVMANEAERARHALRIVAQGKSEEAHLEALHLESFILSREGRLVEQASALVELLRRIDPNSAKYMEHRAWATHTLAALAREIYLPNVMPEVERQLGGREWPPDLAVNRFQALKALGWAKALAGDYFNGFRYISLSARCAPSLAWETVAHCDRAYLAAVTGEAKWSRQEILEAEEGAHAVNWRVCNDEEPVALLLLAELLAPIEAARATEYIARYQSLRDSTPSRSLNRRDPRGQALVEYATGVVDAAVGDQKLARERLKRARDIYRSLQYNWRAARCDLHLFRITRTRSYLEEASELLRNYPSSWLAHELRQSEAPKTDVNLPPMQERVFRYICEGLSNAEIAERLGRSENTVANHAKAVLKAFGVSHRPALIALALKRNLL